MASFSEWVSATTQSQPLDFFFFYRNMQNEQTPNPVVICIFIDNKTTDGDLVNSRQYGAIPLSV